MNLRIIYVLVGAVLPAPGASAADERLRSEKAHPVAPSKPRRVHTANKRVQEKLRALGFYTGPVNGDIGPYTRLHSRTQLSVPIPASGQLDEQTVAALGIERDATTSGSVSRARRHACAVRRPTRR